MQVYKIVFFIFYFTDVGISAPFEAFDPVGKLCYYLNMDQTAVISLFNQARSAIPELEKIVNLFQRENPTLMEAQTLYNETAARLANVTENLPSPVYRLAQSYIGKRDEKGIAQCYFDAPFAAVYTSEGIAAVRVSCRFIIASLLNLICRTAENLEIFRTLPANTEEEVKERREIMIDIIRATLARLSSIGLRGVTEEGFRSINTDLTNARPVL